MELVEATMQLSNLDIIASYVFKGEKQAIPATSRIQNDIIDPSVSSVQVRFWRHLFRTLVLFYVWLLS